MKQIITAIATASVLLIAAPALADGRDHYRGKQDSDVSGSAFRKAYNKERAKSREERRERRGDRRPVYVRDDQGNGRGKGHDNGRGKGHDYGRGKGHDRGNHQGENYDRDRNRRHAKHDKGRDYHKGERRYDKGYERGYKHGYKHGYKYSHDWGHKRPRHKPRRPYYRPGYHAHKPRWRPTHYHYGYRWRHLPSSFVSISVGALSFFYSDGIFYRPASHGYVVASAPVGAVVHALPASAVTVVFGGLEYYVVYDTYYLWDGPRGAYRVVTNPGFY
ncbi:hypothetical protein SAMN04487965_2629 [Microbulbifer donghaiensis]|uniref:Nickel/cobalt transporter regulator n=1 Tax=Microbulbifer donghaiensis TaxID=494016 RepID=A0A1M5E9G8_9GAMM|nr:DUF6515 family protein [Microbulbifer donghaiensis]SHF75846.1 hypothetical protein SAMN04487965_2629 [Microbulbifer donghaiensis]